MESFEGRCTCGAVRYRMTSRPLFVHGCHCTWCQRETGTAFATNAMIESDRVELLAGEVEEVDTPSNSGKGQVIVRCPACKVALWSHYSGAGGRGRFARVGTLAEHFPPDIHIFTSTSSPGDAAPSSASPEYYDRESMACGEPRTAAGCCSRSNLIRPN